MGRKGPLNAIVVTSNHLGAIREAHERAENTFENVSGIVPGSHNGYASFLVAPDGSKSGNDKGLRDCFIGWLIARDSIEREGVLHWVEVEFGDLHNPAPAEVLKCDIGVHFFWKTSEYRDMRSRLKKLENPVSETDEVSIVQNLITKASEDGSTLEDLQEFITLQSAGSHSLEEALMLTSRFIAYQYLMGGMDYMDVQETVTMIEETCDFPRNAENYGFSTPRLFNKILFEFKKEPDVWDITRRNRILDLLEST